MNTLPATPKVAHKEDAQVALLKRAFELCVRKTRSNIKVLADEPKAWSNAEDGNYAAWKEDFNELGNWTTSFFTGMALLAWRETEDEYFLQQTLRLAPAYREKAFVEAHHSHHDMGFLYSLYSVALFKLTGDPQHREAGLQAAKALAQRYNPTGRFIRAWGRVDTTEHDDMAIIDCLMNLPLLHWAAGQTGDRTFYDIAVAHADTTLKTFIRPDDSVCHAYRFDIKTGQPAGPDNYCGYSADSYWARGATWAIYGLALSYGYTRDKKYLEASVRLAAKFIGELDETVIPVWDFRLPPGVPPVRDASAAAVMVCGIQELERHHAAKPALVHIKRAMLERLCSEEYLDFNESCQGVLKNGYGNKPAYSSWGDYFLMEAVSRELKLGEPFW